MLDLLRVHGFTNPFIVLVITMTLVQSHLCSMYHAQIAGFSQALPGVIHLVAIRGFLQLMTCYEGIVMLAFHVEQKLRTLKHGRISCRTKISMIVFRAPHVCSS
jgi:hypothetical protein